MSNSISQNADVQIRKACEKDAAAIVQVHYKAVHETAAKDYEAAILLEWSSRAEDRVERLQVQIINNPENTQMLVAEIGGEIVGFGEIAPSSRELRAVYVSPAAGRSGVGSVLLQELECLARQMGIAELWLHASLTAVPFYLANGYLSDGSGEHALRSGAKMMCIKMHKGLTIG